jgi:glycosyltransferase involved in cell wall biosynthesis
MTKLKILLACEQPLPSEKRAGRPNFTLEFLSKWGHEVTVVCPKPKTTTGDPNRISKESSEDERNVSFEYLPVAFDQFSLMGRLRIMRLMKKAIAKELKQNRYDIIRSNSVLPSYACVAVSKGRIPVYGELTDVLSDYYVQFNMPLKFLGEPMAKRIQRTIGREIALASVDTPVGRRRWGELGMRQEKIVVNPNGVDTSHFSSSLAGDPTLKTNLGFPPDSFLLIWHGDISKNDGIECLLKSMSLLDPNFVLAILGSGQDKYLTHLKQLAASLALGSRVAFTGWIDYDKLPSYLASANMGVAPALPTSPVNRVVFLAKIKEFLAMGKITVATKTEGLESMIGNDVVFYVADPHDSKELASRIESASIQNDNKERLRKMQMIASKIDWQNIISKDAEIMCKLVQGSLPDASEYDLELI